MTGVPVETTISSLEQIITILRERKPDIVILMRTVIPREGYIERLQLLYRAIDGLAKRKSTTTASPVVSVDQFREYDSHADSHADSQPSIYLHPNEKHEQKMADRYPPAVPVRQTKVKRATTPTGVLTGQPCRQKIEPMQNLEPPIPNSPSTVPAAVQAQALTRNPGPVTRHERHDQHPLHLPSGRGARPEIKTVPDRGPGLPDSDFNRMAVPIDAGWVHRFWNLGN